MKNKEIENKLDGWKLITDPEKIYWDKMYQDSIAMSNNVDIRTRGRRKPIIFYNKNEGIKIMLEWDYGKNQWIMHNNNGDIIGTESNKNSAKYHIYMNLKYK